MDLLAINVRHRGTGSVKFVVGDTLRYTLVRPGRVVVRLVLGQDGAQMLLAEDQHAVQKLAAQGAGEPFADRIHTGSLDRCAQDPGASGLEDGVERGSEVRAAVAEQEPEVPEPLAEGKSEVAGLLDCPLPGGMCGDAAEVHPAGAVLNEHQDISRRRGLTREDR